MILIMILTIHLLIGQEINDKDIGTWNKLSDVEKWESYKIAHNSYIRLKLLYDKKSDNENMLIDDLEKTNKLLNKKDIKNSIGLFVLAGLGYDISLQKINPDCYVGLNYKRFFAWEHAYIEFGGAFKFYDEFGGALQFGLGINF
jgi:hypothetical protein